MIENLAELEARENAEDLAAAQAALASSQSSLLRIALFSGWSSTRHPIRGCADESGGHTALLHPDPPMKTLRTVARIFLKPTRRAVSLRPALTALALLLAPALHADTLTVTNNADSGAGTLRQAVLNAAASGDTIDFAAGLSGATLVLGSEAVMAKSLAIDASSLPAGVTISENNASRIFTVSSGQTVALCAPPQSARASRSPAATWSLRSAGTAARFSTIRAR